MQTSTSTLMSDPNDLFNLSISDLPSFSTSLDFEKHLPSKEERESFLDQFMGEEEIPGDNDSFNQSSFAYDMERSIPTRLGTIQDSDITEEEEEDDDDEAEEDAIIETGQPPATVVQS
jgi:hypothetical protein